MNGDRKGKLTRQDAILFILGIVGFLIFAFLYGRLSPTSAVRMEVSEERAAEIAQTFLEQQGLSFEGFRKEARLVSNGEQIMYLQRSLGPTKANNLIKNTIPAYYWDIAWSTKEQFEFVSGEGGEKQEIPAEIKAKVDGKGLLFAYDISIAREDTEKIEVLNQDEGFTLEFKQLNKDEAFELARTFLIEDMVVNLSDYDEMEETNVIHKGGTDWDFQWEKQDIGIADERIEIGVAVRGDQVVTYEFAYAVPEETKALYDKETDTPVPYIVFLVLVWVAIGLIFLVHFFMKALRSELEFKFGLILGIALAGVNILAIFPVLFMGKWGEGLGYFLKAILVVIGASVLWAVCDSLVRSTWREKLAVFDVLGRRRLLTVEYGLATLRGYALAFACLGFVTLFAVFGVRTSLIWLTDEGITSLYSTSFPFIQIIVHAFLTAVFLELIFRLFLVSFLRRRTGSSLIIILVSGLAFGFAGINLFKLAPTWSNTLITCAVAFVLTYAFIRYELTTVILGSFVILSLWRAWPMLYTGNGSYFANGLASLAIIAVPLILAYVSLRRGESVEQIEEYVPPYMARALERERMKQELEIARRVQQSFLPRQYPHMAGLDIAAVCVPANEVGGDYYDFIPSSPERVGIVIGDVSGKGVSAAFYMALTKGLLRAAAAEHDSPKEILSKVNARFYENSDSNVFISMVYGVLDLEKRHLVYARAGHNPVILHNTAEGRSQSFAPPGIALGLDKGEIFEQVIAEKILQLNSGDVLVFYTDGFTEAINWRKEEFGEKRLLDLIEQNKELSADDIVKSIELEIRAFIGDTSQRDDMTLVIAKIF